MFEPVVSDRPPTRRMLIAVPANATGACLIRKAARLAATHGYEPLALYVSARVLTSREIAGLRAARHEAQALGVPFEQVHDSRPMAALAARAAGFDLVVVGDPRAGDLQARLACETEPVLTPGMRVLALPVRAEALAEPACRPGVEALP